MKVLTSNFDPLELPFETFVSRWEELFTSATSIRVGVGYASNDSMLYLKKLLAQLDLLKLTGFILTMVGLGKKNH